MGNLMEDLAKKHVENGNNFLSMGLFDKASFAFQQAIDNEPTDYRGWFGQAQALSANFSVYNASHSQIFENLERAFSLAPDNKKAEIEAITTRYKIMCLYGLEGSVVTKYRGTNTDVEFPEGVTKIGERAFTEWVGYSDTDIVLLQSELQQLQFLVPAGTGIIGSLMAASANLKNMPKIKEIQQKLAMGGYYSSTDVRKVFIPNTVTEIGAQAFAGCKSLQAVIFEEGSPLKEIGESVFFDTGIRELKISEGVEAIGAAAFMKSQIMSIALPSSLRSIGAGAFQNCTNLNSIVISRSVSFIGTNAFYGLEKGQTIYINKQQAKSLGKEWRKGCKAKVKWC